MANLFKLQCSAPGCDKILYVISDSKKILPKGGKVFCPDHLSKDDLLKLSSVKAVESIAEPEPEA